jgi:hypothetical protein
MSTMVLAQDESGLGGDFRRERDRVHDACGSFAVKSVAGCAIELFTDHPLHIAAGSMPPQNGFGLGGAFVTAKNTRNWRLSWDVDAVAATSGAWRAGGYMKMVHTPAVTIKSTDSVAGEQTNPSAKKPKPPTLKVHPYTIFNLYAQSISLNKLNFFGEGNDSSLAGASVFGMNQTIVGGSVIKPVFEWPAISKLNLSLLGEVNGRFVDIRGEQGQSVPSIGSLYNDATAPGIGTQPGFVQLGEGVRIKPVIGAYVQLNYLANFQQFFAPSNSRFSFLRWTVDLAHTISLYGHTQSGSGSSEANGPDECAAANQPCPPVSYSRNLNGSIGLRFLLSESITSGSSTVPFYFQPTLGGSDIDGAPALSSYKDYRFRAPNLMLFRESFEHSVWGPFGFEFMADQGKVATARADIGFDDLKHSFATGITLRAGGFPMVSLLFAWGGSEGHHTIANVNTSLLGGSQRPSLY